ncbi:hypothetical protein BJX62DRAFT_244784 [Aspergillus germanicus]
MSQEPRGNDNDAHFAGLDVENSGIDQHGVPILASTKTTPSSGQWFQGLTAAPAPSETVLGSTTAAVHPLVYRTRYGDTPTEQLWMQAGSVNYAVQQVSIGDDTVQVGTTPNGTLICLWPDCLRQGISFRRKGCIKRHIVTQHLLPRAHWCRSYGGE